MSQNKFEGWGAFDKDSIKGNLKWFEYEPKQFADDDVELKVMYCGICASDLHTMSSGWGDMSKMYPQVLGHEIVGEVVRVGSKVENGLKVGDIAGVGAQCDSCLECERCKQGRENYCDLGQTGTYAGIFHRTSKGSKSFGGYSNYWRGPSHFTLKIPKGLDPAEAAPMMCGGTTVYSPLTQYGAGTTAKDVGVIGVGGLGHFAVLFAAALGANVTAITRSHSKDADAKKMGATKVIATGKDAAAAVKGHERSLDLIICTSNDTNPPLDAYFSLLRPCGYFVTVGAPEAPTIPVAPFSLILNNINFAGSAIGSPKKIEEMLQLAADKGVKPWIKKYSLKDANKAVVAMNTEGARYRFVLVNEQNGGKM